MGKLYMQDWDKWQTYRNDRGTPPWIKVHRCILTNEKWAALSDAEKGQLVSLWVIAADNGGQISDNAVVLKKQAQLDSAPDIKKFIDLGWMRQDGAKLTPSGCQVDAPETETETETETEAPSAPKVGKYAFEGNHIKLTWEDFDKWREVYHTIGELSEFLRERDSWLSMQPDSKKKSWFWSTAQELARRHSENMAKRNGVTI